MLLRVLILAVNLLCNSQQLSASFKEAKARHKPKILSDTEVDIIAKLEDTEHMDEVLDHICIPRVVGTDNHTIVKEYIKSSLQALNWSIETDNFNNETPLGRLKFENIIAKWNPDAKRYLTLACHYDSKYEKNFVFVGATDSAVPCMQLINLAKVMHKYLNKVKNNDISLMMLFLDGEEAFERWTSTDSLYGAKHLAHKWANEKFRYRNENLTELEKIDLFVLLDLIGASNPAFFNYFDHSRRWFSHLVDFQEKLNKMKLFSEKQRVQYFINNSFYLGIEDDHIPFLQNDVPILHLIPYPFPDFWHQAGDNRDAISIPTVENINKILRLFVASYLNIEVVDEQSAEHMEL